MKPVEISDLYSFKFFGNLKAKGSNVVFARGQLNEKTDSCLTDLMLYKEGRVIPLTSRGSVGSFVFQTENSICFFQKDEEDDQKSVLFTMSLEGGEAQKEAEFELAGCSPVGFVDDHRLIFTVQTELEKNTVISGGQTEVLSESPWYMNAEGFISGKRTSLYLYDCQSRDLRSVGNGDLFISQMTIHSGKLYFAAAPSAAVRPSCSDTIYEFDPDTALIVPLCQTGLDVYSLNGIKDSLYLFGTDGKSHGLNTNPCLYEISLDTRKMKLALQWEEALGNTVGTDCAVLGGNSISVDGDCLYFTSTIVNHNNLFCFENGKLHQVLEWAGTIHSFGFCNGQLIFIGAKPGELQELYGMKDGQAAQISSFQTALEGKYTAAARPVFYTGTSGTQQMGWVLYPRDFDPTKTYPGILDIHGGPKTVYGTVFYHEMQVWASHGYFVFFCNPFGSDGQGNDYADLRGKYGSDDYQDLMRFTDAVLEQVPQIDPKRLGVTGGSYGGFMTNWIITHTDRFAAAATQRSISNWISFWGTSDIGPEFTLDQQGADLSRVDVLWDHSPMKYISNAKTPALIIHSDEDYRCPVEQGYQVLNGLLHQGTEARMVLFHHENHELSRSGRPSNRIRRLKEITRWMDSHCKGTDYEA